MPIFVRSVVPLVGLLILAGCSPAPSPTAAATPTPTVPVCVPLDGATPFPCTQADYESLAEQRALYEEAEQVIRRFNVEDSRQASDWKLREMTEEFEATTAGEFRGVVEAVVKRDQADQASRVTDPVDFAWLRAVPSKTREGSIATMMACLDAREELYVTKAASTPSPGAVIEYTYFLAQDAGQLKIFSVESEKVAAC